ncbi:MAG: hypothetical protein H0T45_19890, partial [Pyrinomonadaceae bacterium]|nr:hypothetical protein [Pyrinomonadaceae bacterium]
MNGLLALLALALFVGIVILVPGEGGAAVVLCLLTGIGFGAVIARSKTDRTFLLQLFVIGLLVRATIGFIIYFFELQSFFGGDAL